MDRKFFISRAPLFRQTKYDFTTLKCLALQNSYKAAIHYGVHTKMMFPPETNDKSARDASCRTVSKRLPKNRKYPGNNKVASSIKKTGAYSTETRKSPFNLSYPDTFTAFLINCEPFNSTNRKSSSN